MPSYGFDTKIVKNKSGQKRFELRKRLQNGGDLVIIVARAEGIPLIRRRHIGSKILPREFLIILGCNSVPMYTDLEFVDLTMAIQQAKTMLANMEQ